MTIRNQADFNSLMETEPMTTGNEYWNDPANQKKREVNRDRFKERMIRRSTSMAEAYRSYAQKGLSKEACDVFYMMGKGMRLLVARKTPQGKTDIKLIPDPKLLKFTNWTLPRGQVEVSEGAYLELLGRGVIKELTKYTTGVRSGWLEMDLPGEKYKVYTCTQ